MKITIITVTLNDYRDLRKTAKSILSQTSNNFQWLIKDGISDDSTESFIKKIKRENDKYHIDYIKQKDKSLYDAMNQAVPKAIGEYILFLNAGDILASNKTLEKVIKELRIAKNYTIVYGDNYDLTTNGFYIYKKARDLKYIKYSLPTSHQAIFYNSKIIKNYQYPLNFKICGDYALTAKIYFDGHTKYKKLNFPVCIFNLDGLSTINRKALLKEGYYVHRHILNNGFFFSKFQFIRRIFVFFILDNFPYVYAKIRKMADK